MGQLNVFGNGIATADSEIKHIGENKTPVCVTNVAFNRSFKKGDKWQQVTTFMRVNLWGDRAEKIGPHIKKGTLICVQGILEQNSWEKDGEKRVGFQIRADDIQICEKLTNGNGTNNSKSKNESDVAQPEMAEVSDIPF